MDKQQPEALRLADELELKTYPTPYTTTSAARELRSLHHVNQELVEALLDVLAHLVASHSLLQRGGKKAAPSDTMFMQMLNDYEKSINNGREILAKHKEQA
jgi:hypothetical protein